MAVQSPPSLKHFPGLGPLEVNAGRYVFESQFLKLCYNGAPHRFLYDGRHLLSAYNPGSKRDELLERNDG